jgi:hypothetical protein
MSVTLSARALTCSITDAHQFVNPSRSYLSIIIRTDRFKVYLANILCLCVECESSDKQQLFPSIIFSDWPFWWKQTVFSVRVEMNLNM